MAVSARLNIGEDFVILVHDTCVTSWGKSDFYFQEKSTSAKQRQV